MFYDMDRLRKDSDELVACISEIFRDENARSMRVLLILIENRPGKNEQRDKKILQRVRDDDGAQITPVEAHDRAVDECKSGQRKDRSQTFVQVNAAEQDRREHNRQHWMLNPRGQLLLQIAAKDHLLRKARSERDSEPEQELEFGVRQQREHDVGVALMEERREVEQTVHQRDGDHTRNVRSSADAERLGPTRGAACEGCTEKCAPLPDAGKDEREENPLENDGGKVFDDMRFRTLQGRRVIVPKRGCTREYDQQPDRMQPVSYGLCRRCSHSVRRRWQDCPLDVHETYTTRSASVCCADRSEECGM